METSKKHSGLGDPPKAVSKIVIKKGAGVPGDSITVVLDFSDVQPPISFTGLIGLDFCDWELTKAGKDAGYPSQSDFENEMTTSPTDVPEEYTFTGPIDFDFGSGSGNGVMYRAKVKVPAIETTNFIDVKID